jgi:hypothetical protein
MCFPVIWPKIDTGKPTLLPLRKRSLLGGEVSWRDRFEIEYFDRTIYTVLFERQY